MSVGILWFRRDLRLQDNPALCAAAAAHDHVIYVYIHAPREDAAWTIGAASRWWLHHSLTALDQDVRRRGSFLQLRRGASRTHLLRLAQSTGATAVYWNRLYEPAAIARDGKVERALARHAIAVQTFNANLWFEPSAITTKQGGPYRVFTPFWRTARALLKVDPPLPAPRRIATLAPEHSGEAQNVTLEALRLLPRRDWAGAFGRNWQPGEHGARLRLKNFCSEALLDYAHDRDRPDHAGTSRLSPHLHFGEVSPRQIAWMLESFACDRTARARNAMEPFLRELGWREFSHHLLFHTPSSAEHDLNPRFAAFDWHASDATNFTRWQRGRTGIPIVDAGMRQLWVTGWMHNRVRMLVASFLTKNMRMHWLHGARWFWDTLVDADLANNTQGWQWTAGTGADAAPYFRIFNPVTQGQRFDPDGTYVRRWVPELQALPNAMIHAPWLDPDALRRCGYPEPMVDLAQSRDAALVAYRTLSSPIQPGDER